MAAVSRFRIEYRFPQQVGREYRLFQVFVNVGQVDAFAVILHLDPGGDHFDRIGIAAQEAQLIEERQVFTPDFHSQGIVSFHPDTGQLVCLPGMVRIISHQVICLRRYRAQLRDFRRNLQQERERIVPCGNPASVRIAEIVSEGQRKCLVSLTVRHHLFVIHHNRVEYKHAYRGIPHNQVVTVQQVPDVNIARGIAPHAGKEVSAHPRRISHNQMVIRIPFRITHCGIQRSYCQQQYDNPCYKFLHLRTLPSRIEGPAPSACDRRKEQSA